MWSTPYSVDRKSQVNYRKYVNYGRSSRSVRVRRGVDMAGSKAGFLSKLYEYGRGTFKKRPSASDVVSNQPTVGVGRTWSLYRFPTVETGTLRKYSRVGTVFLLLLPLVAAEGACTGRH